MGEIIAAHAMLSFHVADDRLDGGPSPQLAFDALGDAALLAGDINLEAMRYRRVVTAIAAISDDAIERRADQPLNLGDDDAERVAVIWFARQGPGVDDELPAFRMLQRRSHRRLDAELIRLVRLAFANAFDLRRMQAEDAQVKTLCLFSTLWKLHGRLFISHLRRESDTRARPKRYR